MRPPRQTGTPEAVLGEWVNKYATEFRYPEVDTLPPSPMFGAGGGEFTVTVAAADATEDAKAKADIVATGINDNLTIRAAIDRAFAAGASPRWGRVVLSEGEFDFGSSSLGLGGGEQVMIQGSGQGTVVTSTHVNGAFAVSNSVVCDMSLRSFNGAGGPAITASSGGTIERVWVDGLDNVGVRVSGGDNACTVRGIRSGPFGTTQIVSVETTLSGPVVIDDVQSQLGTSGILIQRSSSLAGRLPSVMLSNIGLYGPSGQRDYGLRVQSTGSGNQQVWVLGSNIHIGNAVRGFELVDVNGHVQLANFTITNTREHGIYLENVNQCMFAGTVSDSSQQTTDTYDNVHVTGTSSRNRFELLSTRSTVPAGQPRYGLFFDSSTEDNIESSDLRDSGATGNYLDNGTNNIATDEHFA